MTPGFNNINIWGQNIEGSLMDAIKTIKDLGVLFDLQLKFDCHVLMVVNKLHQLLGFINRTCTDFTDKLALKSIYC